MKEKQESSFLLALNAAEAGIQVVLARLDAPNGSLPSLICSQWWHAPSQGAELLAPSLDFIYRSAGVDPKTVTRIACVSGPGSFTGLRLAMATASALSRTTGAALAGIPYLPLLAGQAVSLIHSGAGPSASWPCDTLWVLTHARRDLVHMQGFAVSQPQVAEPRTPILILSCQQAAQAVASCPGKNALLGSGAARNREKLESCLLSLSAQAFFLPEAFNLPQEDILLRHASTAKYGTDDIQPLYVRPSDAEDNLDTISAALGLDPDTARLRYADLTAKTV